MTDSCEHARIVAASRGGVDGAIHGAEAEHWTYRRDPLEGIGLLRMALWIFLLIPALETWHRWRTRK